MMKKVLSLGLVGMLMTSGAMFAQEVQVTVPTVGGALSDAVSGAGAGIVASLTGGASETEAEPGVAVVPPGAPLVLAPGSLNASIIEQTSKMGEDVLILEQRQKFFNQIQNTVNMIGVENTLKLYPEYAVYLETSPMALQSQLARVEIMNELREQVARANGPTQYEMELKKAEAEAAAKEANQAEAAEVGGDDMMSMAVNDGSLRQDASGSALTREDVAALIEEARAREEAETISKPSTPIYALVLEEVYGANGQMLAMIGDGDSSYKVRIGDEIPNVGQVVDITREFVSVQTDTDVQFIKYR